MEGAGGAGEAGEAGEAGREKVIGNLAVVEE